MVKLLTVTIILMYTVVAGCQEKQEIPQDYESRKKEINENRPSKPDLDKMTRVGHEVVHSYHRNNKLKSTTEYINGIRNGWQKLYFEDGETLASEVIFDDGKMEGEFKSYFPDGKLRMSALYKNGILEGEARTYFPDGKLELLQKFNKGKLIYQKRMKPDGTVEYEENVN